jgi:hypothetical protein
MMVVSTTPAWGIEPTTSSLGAMSPYHQAKARGAWAISIYSTVLPSSKKGAPWPLPFMSKVLAAYLPPCFATFLDINGFVPTERQ